MTLRRVVLTGFALWLVAHLIGGITLTGGDALERVGTVLVVALGLTALDGAVSAGRRALLAHCRPLPVAIAAAVTFNGLLFWLAVRLADAAGLGYSVTGFLPALLGSVVLVLVLWALTPALTPARR